MQARQALIALGHGAWESKLLPEERWVSGPLVAVLAMGAFLVGCAVPPEREERDRAIWTAIQPCRDRHPDFFHSLTLDRDGRLGGTYHEHLVSQYPEVERCITEALKTVTLGVMAPGRLASAGSTSVSTEPRGTAVIVPAWINGVTAKLLIDTGSSVTIVRPALARNAGIEIMSTSPTVRLIILGGQTVSIPYAKARSVSVGFAVIEDLAVGVYDAVPNIPDIDGILGTNFLSHFKVMLDPQRRRLVLEALRPRAPFVQKPPAAAQ